MFSVGSFFKGPLAADLVGKHLSNCRTEWWRTLLYINNYGYKSPNDMCIPQTFTQTVDFHLWLLAYFPLIWLYKRPRLGVASCLALIAIGTILPAIVNYHYDLPPTPTGRPLEMTYFFLHGHYFQTMHLGTHNNISAYFMGILLVSGKVTHRLRRKWS